MLQDVTEVSQGTVELPSVDGLGGLAGVLERDTEVGTASAGGLGRLDFGGGVTDLLVREDIVRMVLFLHEVVFSHGRRWRMIEKLRCRISRAQGELQHTILTDLPGRLVWMRSGVVRAQSSHANGR